MRKLIISILLVLTFLCCSAICSETVSYWIQKAEALNKGGIYTDSRAIKYLSNAIKLDPKNAALYFNRGVAYSNFGKGKLAIENYNKAIQLKPDFVQAYNNRAIFYLNLGSKKQGCRDALKACGLGNCQLLDMAKQKGYCR